MNLSGRWLVLSRFQNRMQPILITEDVLTLYPYTKPEHEKECLTLHFTLVPEPVGISGTDCYSLNFKEDEAKHHDYLVHEEEVQGVMIPVLSSMGMELDGRGRIVFMTYLKEEDWSKVPPEFESKIYQHYNNRQPVSMINPMFMANTLQGFPPMGCMQQLNGCITSDMTPQNLPPNPQAPVTSTVVDAWDCSCGSKLNTSKFCPNCGAKHP